MTHLHVSGITVQSLEPVGFLQNIHHLRVCVYVEYGVALLLVLLPDVVIIPNSGKSADNQHLLSYLVPQWPPSIAKGFVYCTFDLMITVVSLSSSGVKIRAMWQTRVRGELSHLWRQSVRIPLWTAHM